MVIASDWTYLPPIFLAQQFRPNSAQSESQLGICRPVIPPPVVLVDRAGKEDGSKGLPVLNISYPLSSLPSLAVSLTICYADFPSQMAKKIEKERDRKNCIFIIFWSPEFSQLFLDSLLRNRETGQVVRFGLEVFSAARSRCEKVLSARLKEPNEACLSPVWSELKRDRGFGDEWTGKGETG